MDSRSVNISVPADLAKAMAEIFGDKKNVLWPSGNLQSQSYDLSTVRTKERLDISGDFLYADSDSVGKGLVRFNNASMPAMPFRANTAIFGFPIKEIYLSNTAQGGGLLNLWWGYGVNIIPPSQDITSIGTMTTLTGGPRSQGSATAASDAPLIVRDIGFNWGTSFNSSTPLAAVTAEQIFNAASNPNGCALWDAEIYSNSAAAGASLISLKAHTVAPTTMLTGQTMLLNTTNSATLAGEIGAQSQLNRSRFFSSLGLWFFNLAPAGGEGIGLRKALYTLY